MDCCILKKRERERKVISQVNKFNSSLRNLCTFCSIRLLHIVLLLEAQIEYKQKFSRNVTIMTIESEWREKKSTTRKIMKRIQHYNLIYTTVLHFNRPVYDSYFSFSIIAYSDFIHTLREPNERDLNEYQKECRANDCMHYIPLFAIENLNKIVCRVEKR